LHAASLQSFTCEWCNTCQRSFAVCRLALHADGAPLTSTTHLSHSSSCPFFDENNLHVKSSSFVQQQLFTRRSPERTYFRLEPYHSSKYYFHQTQTPSAHPVSIFTPRSAHHSHFLSLPVQARNLMLFIVIFGAHRYKSSKVWGLLR
jgi:hypothetical protein